LAAPLPLLAAAIPVTAEGVPRTVPSGADRSTDPRRNDLGPRAAVGRARRSRPVL